MGASDDKKGAKRDSTHNWFSKVETPSTSCHAGDLAVMEMVMGRSKGHSALSLRLRVETRSAEELRVGVREMGARRSRGSSLFVQFSWIQIRTNARVCFI